MESRRQSKGRQGSAETLRGGKGKDGREVTLTVETPGCEVEREGWRGEPGRGEP